MYERNLWKIMEAYEHMDEYPQKVHERLRLYDITWDEDDLEENPDFEAIQTDEIDVEYIQEYEGDHRGRYSEIENYFNEFHGMQPSDYETELIDSERIDESTNTKGRKGSVIVGPGGLYLTKNGNGRFMFSNIIDDAMVFNDSREAESIATSFDSARLKVQRL